MKHSSCSLTSTTSSPVYQEEPSLSSLPESRSGSTSAWNESFFSEQFPTPPLAASPHGRDVLPLRNSLRYETESNLSAKGALLALLSWMQKNKTDRLFSKTQIIIAPGYKPKLAKALITNFHQPQSTLLLLVAAFIKSDWKKAYGYALENNFRFLSYGDGSLLWRNA